MTKGQLREPPCAGKGLGDGKRAKQQPLSFHLRHRPCRVDRNAACSGTWVTCVDGLQFYSSDVLLGGGGP